MLGLDASGIEDKGKGLRSHRRLDTTRLCCSRSVFCRLEIEFSDEVRDYNVQGPGFHPLHEGGGEVGEG